MKVLLRSVLVVDVNSNHNGKRVDIMIEGGIITEIKSSIHTKEKAKLIEGKNLHVSAGWLDMQVDFCDPGYEHKENLESGIRAAANGGYTGVCVMPSTNPTLHSKTQIEFIIQKSKGQMVDVYPFGTMTYNKDGKDISEMYDMKLAGAIGFTDDKQSVRDAGLVLRALQYSDNIGSFIMVHCNDKSISNGGQMNEGEQSTRMGLKGIPALAEELMLERNLSVLEYAGGKMHVPTISTKRSVELIREAKSKGLNVTAGVSVNNLFFDDGVLNDFNTNFKLDPPLRNKEDIDALKKGLLNGVIDVIVSDHRPEDVENKELEFDLASFGATGIETAYSVIQSSLGKKLGIDKIIQIMTINPRKILNLPIPLVEEGERANLTVFDPLLTWNVTKSDFLSKSHNSPYLNVQLTGRSIAIIKGPQLFLTR